MGIRDSIIRLLQGPEPERKGLTLNGFDLGRGIRHVNLPLLDFSTQTREGYRKNALVFRCVAEYARRFPEAEVVIRRRDTGEIVPDHPFLDALGNADMSTAELMKYVVIYMAIGGNVYLHKLRSAGGRVVGLFPLNALQMKPEPSRNTAEGMVSHYWLYRDGRRERVEKRDVIHLKWSTIDPEKPWLGMGPLEVLGNDVGLHNEARRYTAALLANDAIPRSIMKLSVESDVQGKDRTSIKEDFEEQYGGDQRGGLLVLPPGGEIQRLSLDAGELALDALTQSTEAAICSAFGVQPGLVAAKVGLQFSTFSNRRQDREAFYEDQLGPMWVTSGDEISQGVGEDIGDGYELAFNSKRIIQRSKDQGDLWLRVISAYNTDLLTKDEARDELGYDPMIEEAEADPDPDDDRDPAAGDLDEGGTEDGDPDDDPKGAGVDPVPFS